MFRGKHKSVFVALVFGVLGYSIPAHSSFITINFDDLVTGTDVTNQYASQGVTFSLIGTALPGPNTYALVDSGGNSLDIFGATGNAINPGDDHRDPFWDIEITFAQEVEYFSIMALDAEESFTVRVYDDSTLVGTAVNSVVGTRTSSPFRGVVYKAEFGSVGGGLLFNKAIIDVQPGTTSPSSTSGGPEHFDNLQFSTVASVPEPTILILMGLGLAGICFARTKQ